MTTHRQLPITVYTPGSAMRQPSQLLADLFRDVWRGRGLAWRLAVCDISAQYRQAALGLLWALILPLANTAVWLFLNGSGIVQISETRLPYAVCVFTGTMLWAIFMDAMNAPLQQATAAKAMLEAAMLPRLIEHRLGPPSDQVRERVTQADPNALLQWSERLLDANSLDEVLH